MLALVRVTTQFMLVAVALSLAACSNSGGGGGSNPPPQDPYGYCPPGQPCPAYGPNGYGPNGPNGPYYNGQQGPNGINGGPAYRQNGGVVNQRRGAVERQIETRGSTRIEKPEKYTYQPPPAYVPPKEEAEPKEETAITREVVEVKTQIISAENKQAPRTSTGNIAGETRTPWNMSETDGRIAPNGGLILKPGDPMINERQETGADSELGASFTDSKEDEAMTYLRHVMKDLPEAEGFRAQSYELAKRISFVDVKVNLQGRAVALNVEIKDEKNVKGVETKNLRLSFKGFLNGTTHAVMKLVSTTDKSYEFMAVVYCIDKSNTCQNTVVEIVQARNGRPCKQAFVVHRFSNFDLRMADDSLGRYAVGSMNSQFMTLMAVFNNTVEANRLINIGQAHNLPSPLFLALGFRAFSVVEGAAKFNLLFQTSTSYTQGASNEVLEDHMVIAGPLLPSAEKDLSITSSYKLRSTNETKADPNKTGLAGKIAHAKLLANNGRGNLRIWLEASSTPYETITFNTMTLAYDTSNLTKFLTKREEVKTVIEKAFQDGVKQSEIPELRDQK